MALITDLLKLSQFIIIAISLTIVRSLLFSCIEWLVSKHKTFCFKKLQKILFLSFLFPLEYNERSGKRTTLLERVASDLMNTKKTLQPQEVNVWSLSDT